MTGDEQDLDEENYEVVEPPRRAPLETVPDWAPRELIEWLRQIDARLPVKKWNLYVKLAMDERMRAWWAWLAGVQTVAAERSRYSATEFCFEVDHALNLPGKPANLTPTQRAAYFEKVRFHGRALMDLLAGTIYSENSERYAEITTTEISEDDLAATVSRDLQIFGDDEPGHIVAYLVEADGVSRLPWTYPESSFFDMLGDVLEWTTWEDGWHANSLQPTWPLAHAKGGNVRVIYFNSVLYDALERRGIKIPFAHLATIANVVFDFAPDEQIDEDVVRKQVRRHARPVGKREDPIPF